MSPVRAQRAGPKRRSSGASPACAELRVDLGDRSYPILVGRGLVGDAGPRLAGILRPGPCAVITNPNVRRLYGSRLRASLVGAGFKPLFIEIPDGERFKSVSSLESIYTALIASRLERSAPLIALGGGVVGDITGFAAATYLRGVPFVQVPTTLLAQVDSSVGGKTGVNHPLGKNLIGAFYQPRMVLADLETLGTLPRREFAAGLAEVVKYGVILDAAFFAELERDADDLLALDPEILQRVVLRSCEIKARVVQADEKESAYRAILNFGHTLGHALESIMNYRRFLHGEAVSIGMSFAAQLSVLRCECPEADAARIRRLLQRMGAPVEMPARIRATELAMAVAGDKKVSGGKVKFVCIERIGRTRFVELGSREVAGAAIRLRDAGRRGR